MFSREGLGTQSENGPFIVEEYDTTILVPPRCTARRMNGGISSLRWGHKNGCIASSASHSMDDYKKGKDMAMSNLTVEKLNANNRNAALSLINGAYDNVHGFQPLTADDLSALEQSGFSRSALWRASWSVSHTVRW